jgi:beta-glucosidase-like glycosyl hydrolase
MSNEFVNNEFVNPFSKENEAAILEIEKKRQRKEQIQRQAIVDLANSLPRKIDGTKPGYTTGPNGEIYDANGNKLNGGKYKRKFRKSKKNKKTRKSRKNKRRSRK